MLEKPLLLRVMWKFPCAAFNKILVFIRFLHSLTATPNENYLKRCIDIAKQYPHLKPRQRDINQREWNQLPSFRSFIEKLELSIGGRVALKQNAMCSD